MVRRTRSLSSLITAVAFLMAFVATPAMAKPPKSGKVEIFSFTKGAKVEVNGKVLGTIPLAGPLVLKPGAYTIRVFKRGFTEFLEDVQVEPGASQELEADLIAFAGVVKIDANVAGATVAVDGKLAGKTPFDKDIPAGSHEFVIQAEGYQSHSQKVDVLAGKPMIINVQLDKAKVDPPPVAESGIHTKWWFWTIIGAVVVGGGATAGVLLSQEPTAEAPSPDKVWSLP